MSENSQKKISSREVAGAFQVSYFLKTISADQTSSKVVRNRHRDRDVFLQFDGEKWVFQGCQLNFASSEECQQYIDGNRELLIESLNQRLGEDF